MHIPFSTLGNCRGILAADLLGVEPSVERQPHWDRVAALGTFGEALVIEYLRAKGNNLWTVLGKQQTLEFSYRAVLYVGRPEGVFGITLESVP